MTDDLHQEPETKNPEPVYLCRTDEGERLASVPAVLFLFYLTHPLRENSPESYGYYQLLHR